MKNKYFQALSVLKPDIFKSTYIIPFKHNFHAIEVSKVSEVINGLNESKWKIINNQIVDELYLFDIKKYLVESLTPIFPDTIEKQELFIKYQKSLLLRTSSIEKIKLICNNDKCKNTTFELVLNSIDLWILDDNIGFFVLHVENSEKIYELEKYSSCINRVLRDYNELYSFEDKESSCLYISNTKDDKHSTSLINTLFSYTMLKTKKSFLNLDSICSDNGIIKSSYYAKMLTSIYIDKDKMQVDNNEVDIINSRDKLTEETSTDFEYFDEIPYLLATTSAIDISSEPMFVSHKRFIYEHLDNNSIHIWRNWVGVALQDSCAFFSIKNGGKNIVLSNSTSNYFLYMMNLIVNIKLKKYEDDVIDEEFINIHKIYPLKRKLQKLKNQYIANEVAIKFQPNKIYNQMTIGLNNKQLIDEVSSNINTTLDLTKQNTDALISAGAVIFAIGSFWEPISDGFSAHPIKTTIILFGIFIILIYGIYKRTSILKKLKDVVKYVNRNFNS